MSISVAVAESEAKPLFVVVRSQSSDGSKCIGAFTSFQDAAEALRDDMSFAVGVRNEIQKVYKYSHIGDPTLYKQHLSALQRGEVDALKFFDMHHPDENNEASIDQSQHHYQEKWQWGETASASLFDDNIGYDWTIERVVLKPTKKRARIQEAVPATKKATAKKKKIT